MLRYVPIALALLLAACADHWEGAAPAPPPLEFTAPPAENAPGPLPEVCDNGVDDDLDTLADCADPECAARELCVVQDERVSIRFEGGLWATYVADEAAVYEDSGRVDGALLIRAESLRDGQWRIDCQTRIIVAGAPTTTEADLAFALAPVLPPEHDGCHLGVDLPELPSSITLDRASGEILALYSDGSQPWTAQAGQLDWSGWSSASDFHVDSQGAVLELAPPG